MPSINSINSFLVNKGVKVLSFCENTKASDAYVEVEYSWPDGEKFKTWVPYEYRRTALELKTDKEIADYILSVKPYFTSEARDKWVRTVGVQFIKAHTRSEVTVSIFKQMMASFAEEYSFVATNNPAKRLQDIKDEGYTVAILPRHAPNGRSSASILVPLPKYAEMKNEVFTPQFKSRVIRLLGGVNAFEARPTKKGSLIPDHKFSEVRWDSETRGVNRMSMTDSEIIEKFQLLDNQRNQQKREICRICLQTKVRGSIYGIKFYYQGDEHWDNRIPEKGKDAEMGCIGCPWYDIEAWRKKLNEKLNKE